MQVIQYGSTDQQGRLIVQRSAEELKCIIYTSLEYVRSLKGVVLIREDGSALISRTDQSVSFGTESRVKTVTRNGLFMVDDGSLYELDDRLSIVSRPIAPSVKVSLVASAGCFSACVSSEGGVFTWGVSGAGCLGLGANIYEVHAPAFVGNDWGGKVHSIAVSESHVLLGVEKKFPGEPQGSEFLFGWGDNSAGQLAPVRNNQTDMPLVYWEPVPLGYCEPVSKIAAGRHQSLLVPLSKSACVYLFGKITRTVEFDDPVSEMCALGGSSAVLLESGRVFGWGEVPLVDSINQPGKVISIGFGENESDLLTLCVFAPQSGLSTNFRPAHLPAKNRRESAAHQLEVARILEADRRMREEALGREESELRLNEWWTFALKGWGGEEISEDIMTVWRNNGLSAEARTMLWPIGWSEGDLSNRKFVRGQLITREEWESLRKLDFSDFKAITSPDVLLLDLPRTFPELSVLSPSSPFTLECRMLLEVYRLRSPVPGYVQGMSFIAALLLCYLPPFEAFVIFEKIMCWPIMKKLYMVEIVGMKYVFLVLDEYLRKNCEELRSHFLLVGFDPEIFLLDWFLTLLTKPLTLDNAAAVWDIISLEGEPGLFKGIVGLLSCLQNEIIGKDFDSTVVAVKTGGKKVAKFRLLRCIRNVRLA